MRSMSRQRFLAALSAVLAGFACPLSAGVPPEVESGTAIPAAAPSQIQKPAPGTAIDWCHPLSAGLVSAVPLNEGAGSIFHDAVSLLSYQSQVLSGTPGGAAPPAWFTPPVSASYPWVGPAISNNGATAQAIQSTLQESDLIKNVTVGYSYAVLVQPLDTATFGRIMDATGSAVITTYLNVQQGKVATTWRDAAGGAIVPMAPFTVNQWILVLCTVQQGLGVMYIDGVQAASSTSVDLAQSWANQTGLLVYNATGNGAMMPNANFSSWWLWNNRVLTAQEAADMYANPWAMFTGSGANTGCAFYPVSPCRAADTRNPAGALGGPSLTANGMRAFPIGGQCGIPADAAAVSTNLTAVTPAAAGYLSAFPAGVAPPLGASAVDFASGRTRANNAVVSLRGGGAIAVANVSSGTVDVVIDVNGYFK